MSKIDWSVFKVKLDLKLKPTILGVALITVLLFCFSYFYPQHFITSFPIWWLSLWVILGQPFIEEYIFRHLLQKVICLEILPKNFGFKPNEKYIIFVLLITSVIFALTHSKSSVVLLQWMFVASMIYAYSYYKTDSLTTSWLLHAVNNFLSFAL